MTAWSRRADGRARRWRLVGRQFGRIAAVSRLFSVLLFPQLFSTLRCAFRTLSPSRVRRPGPFPSSLQGRAPYGELFVITAFLPNERSGNGLDHDGHVVGQKKHPPPPPLSISLSLSFGRIEYRSGSHEQVVALVRLRSPFFSPRGLASTVVLFMPAPLLPPDRRRLPVERARRLQPESQPSAVFT